MWIVIHVKPPLVELCMYSVTTCAGRLGRPNPSGRWPRSSRSICRRSLRGANMRPVAERLGRRYPNDLQAVCTTSGCRRDHHGTRSVLPLNGRSGIRLGGFHNLRDHHGTMSSYEDISSASTSSHLCGQSGLLFLRHASVFSLLCRLYS